MIRGGLGGQLDVDAAYLCGFGEVEDQDPPDYRRGRKFVVGPILPRKINILEIDDRFGQTDCQFGLLLLFPSIHWGVRVEQRGRGEEGLEVMGKMPGTIYIDA